MRNYVVLVAVALMSTPGASWASEHAWKAVAIVHSPDSRDCVFFQLVGVSEADQVAPGNPWFAVPKSHLGFKEIFSMLITARVTGQSVYVSTESSLSCGHPTVRTVLL